MMDERKNDVLEMTDEELQISLRDYKELIIEMIKQVENQGILQYLYTFIRLFLEKWG